MKHRPAAPMVFSEEQLLAVERPRPRRALRAGYFRAFLLGFALRKSARASYITRSILYLNVETWP